MVPKRRLAKRELSQEEKAAIIGRALSGQRPPKRRWLLQRDRDIAVTRLPAARASLDRFYRWCDGVRIPELSRLARIVKAWEARSSPSTPPMGAPTGPPRPSTC